MNTKPTFWERFTPLATALTPVIGAIIWAAFYVGGAVQQFKNDHTQVENDKAAVIELRTRLDGDDARFTAIWNRIVAKPTP